MGGLHSSAGGQYGNHGHHSIPLPLPPREEIIISTMSQGATIGGDMLLTNETISKETIRAINKIEVFGLIKNDYDKFMKEIRSSERRELFTVLRDSFLFEGWSRAKLERLTNLCKKKVYESGEYLFHQGSRPDYLFILLSGELELVK